MKILKRIRTKMQKEQSKEVAVVKPKAGELLEIEPPTQRIDQKKIIEYMDTFGLSDKLKPEEKKQFIEIATAYQLNPFKKEIYCVPYGEGQYRKLSIMTGYEVYLKRAERSQLCDGWSARTEGTVKDESLKALITIHRKDWSHPFTHEVCYSEYVQKTKSGQVTKFWKDKPITMIKKVVVAQAFRMAFPDEMGGMPYTSDELPDEMTKRTDPRSYDAIAERIKNELKPPKQSPAPKESEAEIIPEVVKTEARPDMKGMEPITYEGLAKLYDFKVGGRKARTLPLEKMTEWAAKRTDLFYVSPGDGSIFLKTAPPTTSKTIEVPKPKGVSSTMYKDPEPTPEIEGVSPPTGEPKGDVNCIFCGTLLIKGKEEFGGGWVCWTKKNGCDSKFDDDRKIKSVSKAGALLFFEKFKGRVVNCPLDGELFKVCDGYGWNMDRIEEHFGLMKLEQPVDIMTGTEEVPSEKVPYIFPITPEPGDV